MSNVTPIASRPAAYDEPDFGLVLQFTKDISRLSIFHSTNLIYAMEKAQRASTYALELDQLVGEMLVSLATKANGLEFTELFGQLTEIDHEITKGMLKPEELQAAKEARDEQTSLLGVQLGTLQADLLEAASRIQQKTHELGAVVLSERLQETLAHHKALQPKMNETIAARRAERKALVEDRDKVIAAQDVIRARNLADVYKDFIPENLDKIDLKNPEAEAIRQAVVVLKKLLGAVSEGFRYADLAAQRQVLDNKIERIDGDIRSILDEQQANDLMLRDLESIVAIDEKRNAVLVEVNTLASAFTGLARELEVLHDTVVTEASVTRAVARVGDYASHCLKARNSVILI